MGSVKTSLKMSAAVTLLVVFRCFLVAPAVAATREHVIYPFSDCGDPTAPLIADERGNLYGTTLGGGANKGGCVFKLSPNGDGSWGEALLYNFGGIDGGAPRAALVFDRLGNLYGTTGIGGTYNEGVVFELSPSPNDTWTETVLHNFGSGGDGRSPQSELVFDTDGNLYGTTGFGGKHRGGTVFKLSPTSGGWTETLLYEFYPHVGGPEATIPVGGVVIDGSGNIYGMTAFGGSHGGFGAVYRLSPKNGGYEQRLIHSFDGYDGWEPSSTLVMDAGGALYGTTNGGGDRVCGTVFRLTQGRNRKWTENVLYSLGENGCSAVGPVAIDSAGNIFAAASTGAHDAQGSIFRLTPRHNGSWAENVVHFFRYHTPNYHFTQDGQNPYAGVILREGVLFGTTASGGINDAGTVFSITLSNPASPEDRPVK